MPFRPAAAADNLSPNETDAEILRFIINVAVFTPSGPNTQPWLCNISGTELQLFAKRTRALPTVDLRVRALTISCDAALDHLLVAAQR